MKKWLIFAYAINVLFCGLFAYGYINRPAPVNTNTTYYSEGQVGPQGKMGPMGFSGLDGIDGIDGLPGADGATIIRTVPVQGEKGDKGDAGPKGLTGTQGPQGEPGTNGVDGRLAEFRCHPSLNRLEYRYDPDDLWRNVPNSTCRV